MNHIDGVIAGGKHVQHVRVYYEDTDFSGVAYHASYLRSAAAPTTCCWAL